MDQLRLFEGHTVEAVTYRVAGSVDVDLPTMEWHAKAFLLVEVECDEVKFNGLSKDDPDLLAREHGLKVVRAVVFDDPIEASRILEGLADVLPSGDDR